ncbi:MAG: L-threonylcarbamoyladenylate synthase [Candidatus Woesearchaeota archaeon]|nr:L-threonylcarbamoyladenylate synthase [Candidatus Woesearchaeota archaeon]
MSLIITKDEFLANKEQYFTKILDGAVFVYPTDTIYGIGCSALNHNAVKKIRELKGRGDAPFSVIAPSLGWIEENLDVTSAAREWLAKLPGPYTLVMNMKQKCVADSVTVGKETLGVRIPNHWVSAVIAELGIPLVTTSVNKSGAAFMTSSDDVDPDLKAAVDFIIDEGQKTAAPSTLIFLDAESVSIKRR